MREIFEYGLIEKVDGKRGDKNGEKIFREIGGNRGVVRVKNS